MEFIAHRINTVEELKALDPKYGVELDLRDYNDDILITHDPMTVGERFEDYLEHYKHGTLILNGKCERIEYQVLEMVKKKGIENYFFLDSSFPMIYIITHTMNNSRCALRISEVEGMDTLRAMAGKADWIWVDCFTKFPLNKEKFQELKSLGYNLCLGSPELQPSNTGDNIEPYKKIMEQEGITFDAICTKTYNFERWS